MSGGLSNFTKSLTTNVDPSATVRSLCPISINWSATPFAIQSWRTFLQFCFHFKFKCHTIDRNNDWRQFERHFEWGKWCAIRRTAACSILWPIVDEDVMPTDSVLFFSVPFCGCIMGERIKIKISRRCRKWFTNLTLTFRKFNYRLACKTKMSVIRLSLSACTQNGYAGAFVGAYFNQWTIRIRQLPFNFITPDDTDRTQWVFDFARGRSERVVAIPM